MKKMYIVMAIGEPLGCTTSLVKARKALLTLPYKVHSIGHIRKYIKKEGAYCCDIPGTEDYLTVIKTTIL